MNNKGNNNIPSSQKDDALLTLATENACRQIRNEFLPKIHDEWNILCASRKLSFIDIRKKLIENNISKADTEMYYGESSSIETDSHIIILTTPFGDKPIFMGEMKKQGTNDQRILEGKKKQAIGNAAADRVAKNFVIASDYCYLCDREFFPYNVFMHGCDFSEGEMTTTMKAKLQPFFGKLNNFNPYFDKNIFWARKGGSCFFQKDDFTYEQLYDYVYQCCKEGIEFYIRKYLD